MGVMLPFELNVHEFNSGVKWRKWLRSFEVFAKANKMQDEEEKSNWLLHYAGEKVQDVYFNLSKEKEEEAEEPVVGKYVLRPKSEYEIMVERLNAFFAPKQDKAYERHMFRKIKQEKGEGMEMFVMRLREQAERCEFGDLTDSTIRDHLVENCTSRQLRQKILEHGEHTLDQIMKKARSIEAAAMQQEMMSNTKDDKAEEVCKVDTYAKGKRFQRNSAIECNGCGLRGHKGIDPKCPAKGKACAKCGGRDHFARKCHTRDSKQLKGSGPSNFKRGREEDNKELPEAKKIKTDDKVQLVEEQDVNQINEYDDVFALDDESTDNVIWCLVGGISMEVVIDSGSRYNIIDRRSWNVMKEKGINTLSREKQSGRDFRAYGGQKLIADGKFTAEIEVRHKKDVATFFVVQNGARCLLGRETAIKLKVLKLGYDVNSIVESEQQSEFNTIKDVVIDIPLKQEIKPVIQSFRRVPAPLRRQSTKKSKRC